MDGKYYTLDPRYQPSATPQADISGLRSHINLEAMVYILPNKSVSSSASWSMRASLRASRSVLHVIGSCCLTYPSSHWVSIVSQHCSTSWLHVDCMLSKQLVSKFRASPSLLHFAPILSMMKNRCTCPSTSLYLKQFKVASLGFLSVVEQNIVRILTLEHQTKNTFLSTLHACTYLVEVLEWRVN